MGQLYLRLKRKDTTVFLIVDSSASLRSVKLKLSEATGLPHTNLRLYLGDKDHYLEDETIVADHALQSGAVVAYAVGEEALSVTDFTAPGAAAAGAAAGGARIAGGAGGP